MVVLTDPYYRSIIMFKIKLLVSIGVARHGLVSGSIFSDIEWIKVVLFERLLRYLVVAR